MIEIARYKAEAASIENVVFEQKTIDDLSDADQSFDAVLELSVLHLLPDWEAVIARVHRLLKPGGVFVTSTTCLGDTMSFFKYIPPLGKALGLMPELQVFTTEELVRSLKVAGFDIDQQWQPGKGKAVFIVAKRIG